MFSGPSNRTDATSLCIESFAALKNLAQLVRQPTRIPEADGQNPHLLDLFLTTDPDKYSVAVNAPMGILNLISTSEILRENGDY